MTKIFKDKKMKKLVIAVFVLLFLAVLPSVLAMTVDVKDIAASSLNPVSVKVGETVPITITHVASENATDVVTEVELAYRGKKVTVESEPVDMISGTTYTETVDLVVPKTIKVTSPGGYYTLAVTMKNSKGKELARQTFDVTVQRSTNKIEIQKVITPSYAAAGEPALVTVVAKNVGSNDQEDIYAKISIPEIGLVAEERMGDIAAVDKGDDEDVITVDIPLRIPSDVAKGAYLMNVEVYNGDEVSEEVVQKINVESSIEGTEKFVEVVPTAKTAEISQGKTAFYTLRIANLDSKSKTYEISVEGTNGWATYQLNPLVLTLASESDQLVTVGITPVQNALVGEHAFIVKVKSDSAEKSIYLTADIKEGTAKVDAMLVSVIVLAVVLLVLIVLLAKTRKDDEEIEETEGSYY